MTLTGLKQNVGNLMALSASPTASKSLLKSTNLKTQGFRMLIGCVTEPLVDFIGRRIWVRRHNRCGSPLSEKTNHKDKNMYATLVYKQYTSAINGIL